MTMWVLHQKLTPADEDTIASRDYVLLPFEGQGDLAHIASQWEYRQVLQLLHPDEPPETITRRMEHGWKFLQGFAVEDLIVVPLPTRQELALAEVTGRYQHRLADNGADIHTLPVKWHAKRIKFSSLRKHKALFEPRGSNERAYEIEDGEARLAIRNRLPHMSSGFTKFKWILMIFFAWRAVLYIIQLIKDPGSASLP